MQHLFLRAHSIAAIVLAAGRGTRMGQTPKLLLPLPDGRSVLRHSVEGALLLQPCETVVVTRPDLPALEAEIDHLPVIVVRNLHYMSGMSTSLAAGIVALSLGTKAALVLLADEPQVDPAIVTGLVEAYLREQKPVTIPLYGQQFGPPTLFAREVFPMLQRQDGDVGGRQIVEQQPGLVCRVPFYASMRPQDIDTQEDYEALF